MNCKSCVWGRSESRFSRQANQAKIPSSITNGTNVSKSILDRLSDEWEGLTLAAQKAARYVLEKPLDVGVSTVREIAQAERVKPNIVVRMARQAGFGGHDELRAPFREAIRARQASLPDRAGGAAS